MSVQVKAIAKELYDAELGAYVVDKISTRFPDMVLSDAYAVQLETLAMRKAAGERLIGLKIGLTSRAMQKAIGIDTPDYGCLTDKMLLPEGTPCKMKELIQPKVEGEVAFFLKKGLKGPGLTVADVYNAVDYVAPAIEIVDSRIRDWDIGLLDTVSDNGSSARLVIGSAVTPLRDVDMRLTGMTLEKNGELISSGTTAEVWGNPAAAVAWLANELSKFGMDMAAGQIVLSGAVTAAPAAKAGDCFLVSFGGMGSVGVKFV